MAMLSVERVPPYAFGYWEWSESKVTIGLT
jgi:hypothetical protein